MVNDLIPNFGFLAFVCAGCAFLIGMLLVAMQKSLRQQVSNLRSALRTEFEGRKQIEEDFRALLHCSQNIGRRLRDNRREEEPPQARPLNFNFEPSELGVGDKVHELVERGLSVDEVASICGLTRGEVDFLSRFFRQDDVPHLALKAS